MLGRHPGVRGRARGCAGRRVAVGGAARDLRGAVHGDRRAGVRTVVGGDVSGTATTRDRDCSTRRSSAASSAWRVARLARRARRCSGSGARPTDAIQGDAQRLMYLHVPAGLARLPRVLRHRASPRRCSSGRGPASLVLGPARRRVGRARRAVHRARRSCSGSLWGKPVWGVWWAWDARLVTHRGPLLPLPRLPRAAPHPGRPGRRGQAQRDRRADRVRRRADRPLLGGVVAHAAPEGDGLQPRAQRRRSTG